VLPGGRLHPIGAAETRASHGHYANVTNSIPAPRSMTVESSWGTKRLMISGRPATEVIVRGLSAQVVEGPDRGAQVSRNAGTLRVGTDPSNDLVLTDRSVSRKHAVLQLTEAGIHLEDAGSRNGCWIQGARIEKAIIPDGAQLLVGSTLIRVSLVSDALIVQPEGITRFSDLVSQSPAMQNVFSLVRQMAKYDLPVLVHGETGTGKELVCRALHNTSARASKKYLVLDCGSIVKELLASELFGFERGAFTGATEARAGIFELAQGGTVVLDEIGEMDLGTQTHLLRVLESREIRRLGSQSRVPVDFRLVSATHRNLKEMARNGTFRADLYYRLSAVAIQLPPLREREGDVPLMLQHFLGLCAARTGLIVPPLSSEATALLNAYDWPGNVRELRNIAESLCVMAQGGPVVDRHVRQCLGQVAAVHGAPPVSKPDVAPSPTKDSSLTLVSQEKELILITLERVRWNRTKAARVLGISRSSLYEKMLRFGIQGSRDEE
jgi:DNA-binding NtrC family response regulator